MVRGQKAGTSGDAPEVGVIHLLDRGIGTDVGPHHVLEAEGRLQHELLSDAL